MTEFKKICKKNWYIIVSVMMLDICTEIFMIIINCPLEVQDTGPACIFGEMALRTVCLVASASGAYFLAHRLNNKHALGITLIAIFSFLFYSDYTINEYIPVGYGFLVICFTVALISISFYYVNRCKDSIKNTIRYFIVFAVFALFAYLGAEFYAIIAVHFFLLAISFESFTKPSIKILNLCCAVILAVIFVLVLRVQIAEDFRDFRNLEHRDYIINEMIDSVKPFGKADNIESVMTLEEQFNIIKIFGIYGYVAGILMILLLINFVVSIVVGARKKQGKMKLTANVAAINFVMMVIASVLENLGIVIFPDSHMPIVSLCNCGHTVTGLVIGLVFAADREVIKAEKTPDKEGL